MTAQEADTEMSTSEADTEMETSEADTSTEVVQSVNIDEILSADLERCAAGSKSIEVVKEVEPSIDVGDLLLTDNQPIDKKELKANVSLFLNTLARENAQLLFNSIWKLPVVKVEGLVVAQLPDPTTVLPREKPVPKAKPPTKWEAYAAKKGIQNKKRGRMLWDEEAKSWKPRYGYKRADDEDTDWCKEVPVNSDPNEDQFEKAETEKKERVAKNELQRLRNIAKNQKGGKGLIMSTQFKPAEKKDKERVTKEIDIAKVSTASIGKFQDKLPKEQPNKNTGIKRKFESVAGDMVSEKKRSLDIWNKINKPEALNVTKAVNKKLASDQESNSSNKKKKAGTGKVKNRHFKDGQGTKMAKKQAQKMKGKTLGKQRKR